MYGSHYTHTQTQDILRQLWVGRIIQQSHPDRKDMIRSGRVQLMGFQRDMLAGLSESITQLPIGETHGPS